MAWDFINNQYSTASFLETGIDSIYPISASGDSECVGYRFRIYNPQHMSQQYNVSGSATSSLSELADSLGNRLVWKAHEAGEGETGNAFGIVVDQEGFDQFSGYEEKVWSNTLLGPERVEFSDYTVDRTSTKMKDVLASGSSWTPS